MKSLLLYLVFFMAFIECQAQVYFSFVKDQEGYHLDALLQDQQKSSKSLSLEIVQDSSIKFNISPVENNHQRYISPSFNLNPNNVIRMIIKNSQWALDTLFELPAFEILLFKADNSVNYSGIFFTDAPTNEKIVFQSNRTRPEELEYSVFDLDLNEWIYENEKLMQEMTQLPLSQFEPGKYKIHLKDKKDSSIKVMTYLSSTPNNKKQRVKAIDTNLVYQNKYFHSLSYEKLYRATVVTSILLDAEQNQVLNGFVIDSNRTQIANYLTLYWYSRKGENWQKSWDEYTQRVNQLYSRFNDRFRSAFEQDEFLILLKEKEPQQSIEDENSKNLYPYKLWLYFPDNENSILRYYLLVKHPSERYYTLVLSHKSDKEDKSWKNLLYVDQEDAMNPFQEISLKIRELQQ